MLRARPKGQARREDPRRSPPNPTPTTMSIVSCRLDALLHDDDGGGEIGSEGVSLDEIESLLLKRAVAKANGNVAAAARLLGITGRRWFTAQEQGHRRTR